MSRIARMIATAAAAAALLPAAAGASEIASDGAVLTYTAAPGEANSVNVSVNPYDSLCGAVGAPCLQLSDGGAKITASAGCEVTYSSGFAGDTANCAMASSVVAHLGDRDDAFWDWDGPSTIDAGAGNDVPIDASGGDDVVRGGIGSDLLYGSDGDDVVDGGPGDDYLEGVPGGAVDEPITHGRDVYAGGGGDDSLTYEGRSEDLVLTPDGVADDGAPGEGDNVGADITTVWGGHGADTMLGNAARNIFEGGEGDDELAGREGDDRLAGGPGADRVLGDAGQDVLGGDDGGDLLVGGPGVDAFWGDEVLGCIPSLCASGQDDIRARDGERERINCGPGTDSVEADAVDEVVDSPQSSDRCETAGIAAVAPGQSAPGGGPAATAVKVASARVDRRNRIVVRLTVPEAGTASVRATARVRRTRIRVGRASKAVRRAGEVQLRLQPSRRARRALGVGNRLKVSLRIAFQPRNGAAPSAQARSVTLREGGRRHA
jgi:hypothetical protein